MSGRVGKVGRKAIRRFETFTKEVLQLEPTEFVGMATILTVPLTKKEESRKIEEPRKIEDVFSDMMDKFLTLGKKKQNEINKIIINANKATKELEVEEKDGIISRD